MPTIRTTMNPTEDLEVTDQELTDLSRWGLVLTSTPVESTPEVPGTNPSAANAKGTDKENKE